MADDGGQNLVEFALLLPVLMYILMGIMQFGLVFAAYITVNNAVREGARWGSIYVYVTSSSQTVNDTSRQDGILERIVAGRGILNIPAVGTSTNNFDASGTWSAGTVASDCFNQPGAGDSSSAVKRGDVTICYIWNPTSVTSNDARRGYYMEVTAWYHQQIFMPLLDAFLPDDSTKTGQESQWLRLPGRVTVVIN